MSKQIEIAGRKIGSGAPTYIVAEMSANHHGRLEEAVRIVRAAKAAGADAVKLQTYTPDSMTLNSSREPFVVGKGTLWEGRRLYDLYQEAQTPWAWHPKLKRVADEVGIHLFSSPFDLEAVNFLKKMRVPAYKIASFEIVDLHLIRAVARTGKPMIISTGMARREEIREAVKAARGGGAKQVALLKCTSAYPAPPESANLRTIPQMAAMFGVPIGLSDHTLGIAVPVAAVALGARIIEKHLTMSRKVPGPDSAFSLEPHEFREMVQAVRISEKALGSVHLGPTQAERPSLKFRRSLFVVKNVKKGQRFTEEDIRSIRPGHGLPPKFLDDVVGRIAAKNVKRGTPLSWNLIA